MRVRGGFFVTVVDCGYWLWMLVVGAGSGCWLRVLMWLSVAGGGCGCWLRVLVVATGWGC